MSTESCYNCNQTMERLHSYVDRELTEFELIEVRKHLDDCPPCEKHFEFEVNVKRLVHNKGCPEKAPRELLQQILRNLKQA
jgi:mycothiol system anti-sigma-R factor